MCVLCPEQTWGMISPKRTMAIVEPRMAMSPLERESRKMVTVLFTSTLPRTSVQSKKLPRRRTGRIFSAYPFWAGVPEAMRIWREREKEGCMRNRNRN